MPEVVEVDATRRRRYSAKFKHELVAKCLQPGASVAKLSIDLGLNPNLVRKWMRQELRSQSAAAAAAGGGAARARARRREAARDDTPVPVLQPGRGTIKTGRL